MKYKVVLLFSLVFYFILLSTLTALHIWAGLNLRTPLYVPLSIGGAFFVLALLIVIILRVLHRIFERKLIVRFYKEAQSLGFVLERIKTKKTAYNYSELFTEAGLNYAEEFTKVAGYELGKQQLYVLFFYSAKNIRAVLHLPERQQKYYYQINNTNTAPPHKFREQPLLKLHFVHELALNYYASSNDTDVKIYLRKVLEKRFARLYAAYAKPLIYTAFPDHEFLDILEAFELCEIKLNEPLTNEQIATRFATLFSIQKLVHIMLEKREPWRKN